MRLSVERGKVVVLVSADMERSWQVVAHNPGYADFVKVDLSGRFVYRLVSGEWVASTVKVVKEDGSVKKAYKPVKMELKELPKKENTLYILTVSSVLRDVPRPVPHPSSAVVIIASDISYIPESWTPFFDDYLQDNMVDRDDIIEVMGYYDGRLEGLAYGELRALRAKVGLDREAAAAEAGKMRVKRFVAAGLVPETGLPDFNDIPLDSYFRDYLRKHLRIGACVVLVGPPGSGKTYLALGMAGSLGMQTYSTSAAKFLELSRDAFNVLMTTLRYAGNSAIVVNEFDRLVAAEARIRAAFLTYLEKRPPSFVAGTAVNIDALLESADRKEGHPELVRPGRVDEVIPVPPLRSRAVVESAVRRLNVMYGLNAGEDVIRRVVRVCYGEPLYPADYLSLLQRAVSGERDLAVPADAYRRYRQFLNMCSRLESMGLTSPKLVDMIAA